jgi:hypothetical protein
MIRITLDSNTTCQLANLDRPVELCDPAGKVIGRFMPSSDMSGWERLTTDVTEEELDRREAANEKRYTTAEVTKRLESL